MGDSASCSASVCCPCRELRSRIASIPTAAARHVSSRRQSHKNPSPFQAHPARTIVPMPYSATTVARAVLNANSTLVPVTGSRALHRQRPAMQIASVTGADTSQRTRVSIESGASRIRPASTTIPSARTAIIMRWLGFIDSDSQGQPYRIWDKIANPLSSVLGISSMVLGLM